MYKAPTAVAPALYIPGILYEALVRLRNGMYSAALLPQRRLPKPVISIGNITMGGTGKTPLVIYVARLLLKLGFTPAVLTRGHGRIRSSATHILAPGETTQEPDSTLGDEPALIRRHVPSCWMGVSKNRFVAGSIIAERDSRVVFVLDDGFQHRELVRNLDIVVIDGSRPLGSDRVFPRGTLREPAASLHRANHIVINGNPDSADAGLTESEIRKVSAKGRIFHCHQFIRSLTPFPVWQKLGTCSPEDLVSSSQYPESSLEAGTQAGKPSVYIVSAVGNPKRFRSDIQRIGFGGVGGRSFSDHHRLSRRDWQNCVDDARREGADTIVTTEKDAIKISEPFDFPLLVAEQSTELAESGPFEAALKTIVEEFQ